MEKPDEQVDMLISIGTEEGKYIEIIEKINW